MSRRDTFTPTVYPFLYEVLWSLAIHGPLTAGEIADDHNRPRDVPEWAYWDGRGAANRLRTPQRLGLVERDPDGFWLLTDRGRTWLKAER